MHVRARARTRVSTRGRIGRFVRGVAIHEFIRDRICTWQPELLVIKMRRSPFVPTPPRAKQEQEVFRSSSSSPSRIMYAEEVIRARAALSPFPPKHVVFNFSPRSERSILSLRWIFLLVRLLPSPGSGPGEVASSRLPFNRESSTIIRPFSVVPPL